jgi:hypothetical protein
MGKDGDVSAQHARENISQDRLANPAQGQAGDRNAELNPIDDFVNVLVKTLNDASANATGLDELLNARVADADQGKFSSGKEGIDCNQEKDQKDPEQYVRHHGCVILTFQRH